MKTARIINHRVAMPIRMLLWVLLCVLLLLLSPLFSKMAHAQELDLGIEPDVEITRSGYNAELVTGTHGIGAAFLVRNYYYGLRLLHAAYENRVRLEENNNDNAYEYTYRSDFTHSAVIANIYPLGGSIFISSGVFNVDMQYEAKGYVRRKFTENKDDYLLEADYTTLVSYKGNAPYLGVGISTVRHPKRKIGLRAAMGVIFMPAPDTAQLNFGTIKAVGEASLETEESLAAQAELQEKTRGAYLAKIKRDAEDYNYFPVFELGITYSF